jgi:hypothetical protein
MNTPATETTQAITLALGMARQALKAQQSHLRLNDYDRWFLASCGIQVEAPYRVDLSQRSKLTILRGQLTVIRARAESGIPVSVESLARAENVARSLEAEGLAE